MTEFLATVGTNDTSVEWIFAPSITPEATDGAPLSRMVRTVIPMRAACTACTATHT